MMKKVNVDTLMEGMYVCQLDKPWIDTPYLLEGIRIEGKEDVDELKRHCKEVYIDTERGIDVKPRTAFVVGKDWEDDSPKEENEKFDGIEYDGLKKKKVAQEPIADPGKYKENEKFEDEIGEAREIRDETKAVITNMYEDVRLGKSIDTQGAKLMVSNVVNSIVKNPDTQIWLTQLKNKDEYLATHSLNVCIFSLAFGRHLGMSEDMLNMLGLGALLHDLGKIKVPSEVLDKPGKLTTSEFSLIQKHPGFGQRILDATNVLPTEVIDVALSHHERMDGSGYPFGKNGGDINLFARVVSVVDIYDAITSARCYHEGKHTMDAMKQLYEMRLNILDIHLVEQFIQCLGIYPVGTIVELNNRSVGIVIEINRKFRLKPKVLIIRDENQIKLETPKIIDLVKETEVNYSTDMDVKRVVDPGEFNINVRDYVNAGPLL